MKLNGTKWIEILLTFSSIVSLPAAFSATRKTDVPNNFVSVYAGFTSVSNTDVTMSGDKSSWIGVSNPNTSFSLTLKDLEQNNAIWGGLSFGHWFKQAPISLGFNIGFDVYPATIKEQTKQNVTYTLGGQQRTFTSFTKYRTSVVQAVPAAHFLVGVPLGFVRLYAGVGPGIFASFYSFTIKSGGKEVGQVTATDAKIGFNAFAGVDFFVSRHFSVYLEGKYSQVNNLTFKPNKTDPLVDGRSVQDEYNSIKTQRAGIGGSYHF